MDEVDGRTLFFDWLQLEGGLVSGHSVRCQLLTVPGQGVLEKRRFHLLGTADVVVFVCESTRVGVSEARATLGELWPLLGRRRGRDIPLVVQANKQDEPGALSPAEIAEALELPDGVDVVPARAADGTGVRETVVLAIRAAANQLQDAIRASGLDSLLGRPESPDDLVATMRSLSTAGAADGAAPMLGGPTHRGLPPLPTDDVPDDHLWPADGRDITRRALAWGETTHHPELANAQGLADGSGRSDVFVLECGLYCLKTSRRRWRPDEDSARDLLRDLSERKARLGDLRPRRTALALKPDPAGGVWLWTVSPWLTTMRASMTYAAERGDAAQLGETLAAYARVAVKCIVFAATHGTSLDVHPSNFGIVGDHCWYLDDDVSLSRTMPLVGHALLRRAEEYQAWPTAIERYVGELERSMRTALDARIVDEVGLHRALETTPVRSGSAVHAKDRLLAVASRLAG
jgi:hypothetical protein